jgi:hypothetical protein
MFATAANNLPTLIARYPTSQPWSLWIVVMAVSVAVSGLAGFVITIGLAAPLGFTAPRQLDALGHPEARRRWAADALWAGVLATLWTLGWNRTSAVVTAFLHTSGQPPVPAAPAGYTTLVPGLADLLTSPLHAIWYACALGILLPTLHRLWTSHDTWDRTLGIGALLLMWVAGVPAVHTGAQFALAAVLSVAGLVLLLGFAVLFLRDNPLAYLSTALVPALVGAGVGWFGSGAGPSPLYGATIGLLLLALAAGWLAWLARLARARSPG